MGSISQSTFILNSDYTSLNPLTVNPNLGPRELAFYRITFMLMNYAIGYLRYPSRIWRTFKKIFFDKDFAATVFEHRLKDLFKRKKTTPSEETNKS